MCCNIKGRGNPMNQQLSSDTSKNPCTYELQFASDFSVLFNADQTLISKNIILKTSLFISKLCKNKLHHVPVTRLHINRSCFINTLTNMSLTLSLSHSFFTMKLVQHKYIRLQPHIVLSIIIVN